MIKTYLNNATIHGLRYLIGAKSVPSIFRLIWFTCILGSFAMATIIIVLNVQNWENSPAVVTSVDDFDIEDQLEYPTVTICPKSANIEVLVKNYYNRVGLMHPGHELTLKQELIRDYSERSRNQNQLTYLTPYHFKRFFTPCLNESILSFFDSKPCRFARLLIKLRLEQKWRVQGLMNLFKLNYFNQDHDFTINELTQFMANQTGLSFDEMTEVVAEDDVTNLDWTSIGNIYLTFFPLETERGNISMPIQGIEDFKLGLRVPPLRNNPQLGDLLHDLTLIWFEKYPQIRLYSYMIETLRIIKEKAPLNESTHLITSTSLEAYFNMFDLLSLHSDWFFPSSRPVENDVKLSCEAFKRDPTLIEDLVSVCSDELQREGCKNYCNAIKDLRKNEDFIIDLFKMTIEGVKGDDSLLSLPACKFGTQNVTNQCWHTLVTDMGNCYTTYSKDQPIITSGSGEDAQIMILTDQGALSKEARKFQVLVTPPGHFSSNRFTRYPSVTIDGTDDLELTIDVTKVIKTTQEFKAMSLDKRRCYYPEEKPLNFFPVYSEANCVMECAWNLAKDRCQCIPWFLKDFFPDYPFCEFFGNHCFKQLIANRYKRIRNDCTRSCWLDCESVQFDIKHRLRPEKIAGVDNPDNARDDIDCQGRVAFTKDRRTNLTCQHAQDFVQGFAHTHLNLTSVLRVKPNVFAKRLRLVTVSFNDMGSVLIKKTATMTIIDMISNIGGTLGLFLGFSLLSGVEILYHLALALLRKARRAR